MSRLNPWVRVALGLIASSLVGWIAFMVLQNIDHEWTKVTMAAANDNMGDQMGYRAQLDYWSRVHALAWIGFVVLGFGVWLALFPKVFKSLLVSSVLLVVLAGCGTAHTVIITPPNYGIVVDLSSPTNQATANNFGSGELLNLTQVSITEHKCASNSVDSCPDKLVAEVPGSPESRIYTQDPNTGTAGANQALCFEARGTNGCVDFSVTAIIKKEDARAYANKMGVKPVENADKVKSRFYFKATPLADALDTRVIQIAGAEFAKATADKSPLDLAVQKFSLFEAAKPRIIAAVHDQTAVTIIDIAINGGIVWSSQAVQDTIDQATIIQNRHELATRENEVEAIRVEGKIARARKFAQELSIDPATAAWLLEWNGSGYVFPQPVQPAATVPKTAPVPPAAPATK